MRIDENRLVKVVLLVALEMGTEIRWVENSKQGMEEIGWIEVVQMLRNSIWWAVKESWAAQAKQHSKLKVVREMMKGQ